MINKRICQRNCDEYEKGMKEIVAAQLFCYNHSAGPKYTSKGFRYCPWCGSVLVINPEYKKQGL